MLTFDENWHNYVNVRQGKIQDKIQVNTKHFPR